MPLQNDATASYLGYLFQGQYALFALWDAEEGDFVSVETDDDVVLEGSETVLAQLKHSEGTPAPVTITNVGFWKTVRIWIRHLSEETHQATLTQLNAGTPRYLFVTVGEVSDGDALRALIHGAARDAWALAEVTRELVTEATRVRDERVTARDAGRPMPHAERGVACEEFVGLASEGQHELVKRVMIVPGSFRITDVAAKVERRLRDLVRSAQRPMIAERLIERWDRQVALALMKRRSRRIAKEELTGLVNDLVLEHGPTALPNDFGSADPDPMEIAADAGGNIERQIVLVDGGAARIGSAIRDRWRARNQRERWMQDDASLVPLLKAHDDALKEAWGDVHGPMCDDCRGLTDNERRQRGLQVLDWARAEAVDAVDPPRPDSRHPFYVRGMLQQLADNLEIGWHPDYADQLGASTSGAGSGTAAVGMTPDAMPDASALRDELPVNAPLEKFDPSSSAMKKTPRKRRPRKAGTE